MALSINTQSSGGGDFLPIVKFDARAGRFSRVDRVQGAAGWESNIEDITSKFKAVFDLEKNLEVGWMNFATGGAPDIRTVPNGQPIGDRPSEQHKEGMRLIVKLARDCGGDVREFCSVAKVVLGSISLLHDEYLAGVTANPGKLPVVAMEKTLPITTGSGAKKSTNYEPVFKIVSWVARPADLVPKPRNAPTVSAPATTPAAPAATGSTRVAAPAQKQPETVDADDFG